VDSRESVRFSRRAARPLRKQLVKPGQRGRGPVALSAERHQCGRHRSMAVAGRCSPAAGRRRLLSPSAPGGPFTAARDHAKAVAVSGRYFHREAVSPEGGEPLRFPTESSLRGADPREGENARAAPAAPYSPARRTPPAQPAMPSIGRSSDRRVREGTSPGRSRPANPGRYWLVNVPRRNGP
jgi:hypothetical protein